MADVKITALTAISANPVNPATFPMPMVDLLDTSQAASGSTRKVTVNQILGAGGTATLASATITGAATVGTTLGVTGASTLASVGVTGAATVGTTLGVTGVSTFAAGTALLPALTTTGDTNTGIYYPAADTFAVTTGGTERYRVNSSGQVGIGVTPTNAYSTSRALQIGQGGLIEGRTSDYTTFSLATNAYLSSAGDWTYSSNAAANLYAQSNGAFTWASVAAGTGVATFTPAMTLDASGNLLVGTTTQLQSANSRINVAGDFYNLNGVSLKTTNGGSGSAFIAFINESGAVIGSINRNGATNAVNYNTSSDYRLKESIAPLNNGLARVNALKPSIYKWKSNGSDGEGFLAHELAEAVPFAVSGEKDAMNADGTIKSQGIDMSRIVPILVAAIQELTARVQTLEAR